MKRKFLPLVAISAMFLSSQTYGQANRAYAVTGETKGNYNWNVIREVDLSTGEITRTIYSPLTNKSVNYKAVPGTILRTNIEQTSPTGNGVAAAAFDAVHNRLYFTNMRGSELMYFDLNSSDVSVVVDNNAKFNTGDKYTTEANVITRMAFGADGNGYAITNDGKSILRFTTDQKPSVTNLGELIDGKKNGTMSVHSQCSSWGGDLIGDAYGNLYLVTYRNHLYKINPQTRVTDYLGQIKNLPADFTSNAMVVDDNGDVLVSSATVTSNYYRVNMATLDATPINKKDETLFNCSDLASKNLLYQSKVTPVLAQAEIKGNSQISIYPNPSPNKQFNVQFDKIPAGKYNLVLSDASGRAVLVRSIVVGFSGQLEKISIPKSGGSGIYMVKLTGENNKVVYNDKIVVQ